jgi:hypothetical protein
MRNLDVLMLHVVLLLYTWRFAIVMLVLRHMLEQIN